MSADRFFADTNIFLYSLSANEADKQALARRWLLALWSTRAGHLSWQVINEFYSNAVRKLGVVPKTARNAVEQMMQWEISIPRRSTMHRAWYWCDSAHISYWDALIVAAAEQAGCQWLLSEDFQAGRRFGSVTVVNPFTRDPTEFGLTAEFGIA